MKHGDFLYIAMPAKWFPRVQGCQSLPDWVSAGVLLLLKSKSTISMIPNQSVEATLLHKDGKSLGHSSISKHPVYLICIPAFVSCQLALQNQKGPQVWVFHRQFGCADIPQIVWSFHIYGLICENLAPYSIHWLVIIRETGQLFWASIFRHIHFHFAWIK